MVGVVLRRDTVALDVKGLMGLALNPLMSRTDAVTTSLYEYSTSFVWGFGAQGLRKSWRRAWFTSMI